MSTLRSYRKVQLCSDRIKPLPDWSHAFRFGQHHWSLKLVDAIANYLEFAGAKRRVTESLSAQMLAAYTVEPV